MQTSISTLRSVEVLPVYGGRRRWPEELKARIVSETAEDRKGGGVGAGRAVTPALARKHETLTNGSGATLIIVCRFVAATALDHRCRAG